MSKFDTMFINGKWVAAAGKETVDVINPCTEEAIATVRMGNGEDVDRAVMVPFRMASADSRLSASRNRGLLRN